VIEGGQALQVVTEPPDDPLTVVSLSGNDAGERRRAIDRVCQEIAGRGFDLSVAPLCRVALLPIEPDRNVLLVVLHHLVYDHWSAGVFLRDLAAAYTLAIDGNVPDLAPLPITYQDFTIWQRSRLARGTSQPLLDYWQGQLGGLAMAPLPYDFPRQPDHDFAGASVSITIPSELRTAVRSVAAARWATPYMVLLAAFFALLHQWTGGTDLCIGSPYANRGLPEIEPLIGYFVNMVGLRVDLSGDPTLSELVNRTRSVCIDAYNHQQLPFHLVARMANGHERQPGATPLFQTVFTMDDDPAIGVEVPELSFGPITDVQTGRVGFDLVLLVVNRRDELVVTIDYSTRLFRPKTVRRMLADYESILRRVTMDPEIRLSTLAVPEEVPILDALCRLWAKAFGVAIIAPDQDFFEMGGSSLLAAKIVADIGELIGTEVSLRTFFEAVNVSDLAERIGREYGITTISAQREAEISHDSIEELIGGMDDLSDAEVRAALGDLGSGDHPEGS
jgi:hypothetical protein